MTLTHQHTCILHFITYIDDGDDVSFLYPGNWFSWIQPSALAASKLISPSATYIHQWIGSALVQILARRIFGATEYATSQYLNQSVASHYLNQCWIIVNWPSGVNFSDNLINLQNFHSRKCNWEWLLWNSGHFVRGDELTTSFISSQPIRECPLVIYTKHTYSNSEV